MVLWTAVCGHQGSHYLVETQQEGEQQCMVSLIRMCMCNTISYAYDMCIFRSGGKSGFLQYVA